MKPSILDSMNHCPKCNYDKPIKQINPECPFKWICGKCPELFN